MSLYPVLAISSGTLALYGVHRNLQDKALLRENIVATIAIKVFASLASLAALVALNMPLNWPLVILTSAIAFLTFDGIMIFLEIRKCNQEVLQAFLSGDEFKLRLLFAKDMYISSWVKKQLHRKDKKGNNALLNAVKDDIRDRAVLLLKYVPSLLDSTNNNKETALHLAALNATEAMVDIIIKETKSNQESFQKLLQAKDKNEDTALHRVVESESVNSAIALIEEGLDRNKKNKAGKSFNDLANENFLQALDAALIVDAAVAELMGDKK